MFRLRASLMMVGTHWWPRSSYFFWGEGAMDSAAMKAAITKRKASEKAMSKNSGGGGADKPSFSISSFFKKESGGDKASTSTNSILATARKDSSGNAYFGGDSALSSRLPAKGSRSKSATAARTRNSLGGSGSGSGSGSGNKKARTDYGSSATALATTAAWAGEKVALAGGGGGEEALDEVTLSEAQRKVLQAIVQRKSIFFTGAAGTGKSFVLRVLQQIFGNVRKTSSLSITATTGIAACNIRGMTVHSWSGLGMGNDSMEMIVAKASKNPNVKKRWLECETLVIDEISMLSAELFDKVSAIGRRIRSDPRPFGGLQVIVCGDFFQLPPIGLGSSCHFCFDSPVWKDVFGGSRRDGMIVLDKVFRQKDSAFLRMLNELRRGHVSSSTEKVLLAKVAQSKQERLDRERSGMPTTKLFPVNKYVDEYNSQELAKLRCGNDENGHPLSYLYRARDEGDRNLLTAFKSGPEVELRIGAQVMLLKNISTELGLVNGTRGKVVRFEDNDNFSVHSTTAEHLPENLRYFPVIEFATFVGNVQSSLEYVIDFDNPNISWINDVMSGDKVMACRTQIVSEELELHNLNSHTSVIPNPSPYTLLYPSPSCSRGP